MEWSMGQSLYLGFTWKISQYCSTIKVWQIQIRMIFSFPQRNGPFVFYGITHFITKFFKDVLTNITNPGNYKCTCNIHYLYVPPFTTDLNLLPASDLFHQDLNEMNIWLLSSFKWRFDLGVLSIQQSTQTTKLQWTVPLTPFCENNSMNHSELQQKSQQALASLLFGNPV